MRGIFLVLPSPPYNICFVTALFGEPLPFHVVKSWKDFRYYFAFILHPLRDPKTNQPIAANLESFLSRIKAYSTNLLIFSAIMCMLLPVSFEPFDRPRPSHEIFLSFHPAHLTNNFIAAGKYKDSYSF